MLHSASSGDLSKQPETRFQVESSVCIAVRRRLSGVPHVSDGDEQGCADDTVRLGPPDETEAQIIQARGDGYGGGRSEPLQLVGTCGAW